MLSVLGAELGAKETPLLTSGRSPLLRGTSAALSALGVLGRPTHDRPTLLTIARRYLDVGLEELALDPGTVGWELGETCQIVPVAPVRRARTYLKTRSRQADEDSLTTFQVC